MQMLYPYTRKTIQQIRQISDQLVFCPYYQMFERVIYNQLGKYMDTYLNKLLCVFRKAHSTQHALDNFGLLGTIPMDLSKAYNCLPHDLIIAKFEVYGLLLDYLTSRK